MTIIRKVSDKFDKQEYEFAVPYFFEEMANGDLTLDDIEAVIKTGIYNVNLHATRLSIFVKMRDFHV